MAEKVEGVEWGRTTNGKYPWDQWLDGDEWRLFAGKDFRVDHESLRTQAYVAASRKGVRCRTRWVAEEGVLYIQALPS